MVSKREARERRQAIAREKFDAHKATLIDRINQDPLPRIAVIPAEHREPRLPPHQRRAADLAIRSPVVVEDGSRFRQRVTWCHSKADLESKWSWGEPRSWSQEEWERIIHPPFVSFSNLTWQEIDAFSSESGHKMHHGHEVGDLIIEAQRRWLTLDLEQFESIFRFRLGGTKRVWGYIVQSHFHIVWWDRSHSIYPTEAH
jgi:hypothetical protein